ncbi:ABC transporter permease [Mycoplasmatota bacterium WC44]
MSKYILLKSFFKKEYILFKRYFFNSIGGLVTIYIIFLLIFLGYKGLIGNSPNFGRNVEGLIVGYTLWMFALVCYQEISANISIECREGTLEQLYMSAYPFRWILIVRTLASVLFSFIIIGIMTTLLMVTTGRYLNIDLLSIIPVILLTLLCFYSIGLMIGGITLVFKKIGSFLQIIQFAIVGFIVAPISKVAWFRFLPGTLGSKMISKIMIGGESIFDFSVYQILELAIIGIVYLILGSIVYKICENKAMEKGILGHY